MVMAPCSTDGVQTSHALGAAQQHFILAFYIALLDHS